MNENRNDRALYWKEQTTQYNVRFTNETGVPVAITEAAKQTGETGVEYIKNAVVQRLQKDGFLRGNVVLNQNKQRHREKLKRLEEYLAQEKRKMK